MTPVETLEALGLIPSRVLIGLKELVWAMNCKDALSKMIEEEQGARTEIPYPPSCFENLPSREDDVVDALIKKEEERKEDRYPSCQLERLPS